jgi:hypothetical protein
LVEERRQEVHGLESVDTVGGAVVLVVESRNNKQDEVHQEPNLLHPFPTVELVVDQERSEVVTSKGATNIDQVPEPASHDGSGARAKDLDELRLEKLVSVKEDIVAEPSASCCGETSSEVRESQFERVDIVTIDICLPLGGLESLRSQRHLEVSVVAEPKGTDSGDGE